MTGAKRVPVRTYHADGEKIQIGEQLDWRVTFSGPGGTAELGQSSCISRDLEERKFGVGLRGCITIFSSGGA